MGLIRRWFFAGLLVWVPLGVTLFVLRTLISLLDASLVLVPTILTPDWFSYPGIGAILTIVLVLTTGALTANLIGEKALGWIEGALHRVPFLGPVYGGMKKVTETMFSGQGNAFQKVVLVEFPYRDCWTIGFVTAPPPAEMRYALGEAERITVFVPTTPNPTAGFLLLKPKNEIRELNISVQDGMQYLISLGVVPPGSPQKLMTPGEPPANP